MTDARAFEDAIAADPDDAAAYLVYADWLQGRGDPRGELIVLQHRRMSAHGDAREAIDDEIRTHFDVHAELLLGPLGRFDDAIPSKRTTGKSLALEWRNGYVESIAIGWGMGSRGGTPETAKAELLAILAHPSARFVTSLTLGPAPEGSLDPLAEALAETGLPTTLRHLVLGEIGDWDISGTATGDFGAIAARFPRLRSVKLCGGAVTLGDALALPELRMLTIETGGLTTTEIRQIGATTWPALESLNLWFGHPDYGGDGRGPDLVPLLDARGLPKLRHLGLMNCPWIDEAVEMLVSSRVLPQLESLDLSMGALTADGLAHILDNPRAFGHLASIVIDDNAVPGTFAARLAAFTPRIELGEQDPVRGAGAIEDRYCTVEE